jgi:hypothetical protein
MSTTSKLGADMTDDEIMHVVGYSTVGSNAIAPTEWCAFARAILARQPAAIGKEANQQSGSASDLAFSVYSGINALRWLLNITTEFDRKDVRTRQAARLLDEYTDSFGKTNRDRLEAMWKALNDSLPNDGRINEYLRAHDAAGRAASTSANVAQDERGATDRYQVLNEAGEALLAADHCDAYEVIYRMMKEARTASANVAQGAEQPVYAYVYEYDTAFGLHRQFEPGTYNGSNPKRTVKVYAAPPAQSALTDDARDAARYRFLRAGFGDMGPEVDMHNAFVDGGEVMDRTIDAALTDAQSASEGNHAG